MSVPRRRHVLVKSDGTLVLLIDNEPYIEIRPHYEPGLGPVLHMWRVHGTGGPLGFEPAHLATLRPEMISPLVQKLPIVLATARRLARQAAKNGGTEPNANSDSSSS